MSEDAEDEAVRASLRSELGDAVVRAAPDYAAAGCRPCTELAPRDGAELSAALQALSRSGEPALILGGGSRLGQTNVGRTVHVALRTAQHSGIDELDAADGVARVAAGTLLRDLAAEVDAAGWELPLDPPGSESTLGGALASAAEGPRRLAYGRPRYAVLGLDTVLASGERTRCGGRVVKNVTGYDLAKLYVGSFGSLAVIESAWLRLRARPRETRVQVLPIAPGAEGFRIALEAARRPSARVAALLSSDLAGESDTLRDFALEASWLLLCEWAGDSSVCRQDADWLARQGRVEEVPGSVVEALRALQADEPEGGMRARLHVLPSAVKRCCGELREAGARLLAYPVPGVIYAGFGATSDEVAGYDGLAGEPAWLGGALEALERVTRGAGGGFVLEALPERARSGRDVFGDAGEALPLMRALKTRFDPNAILNPGRFVGGL